MRPQFDPRVVALFLVAALVTGSLAYAHRHERQGAETQTSQADTSDDGAGDAGMDTDDSGAGSSDSDDSADNAPPGERSIKGAPGPHETPAAPGERIPNTPGDFDYYTLVLSWSPTHCVSEDGAKDTDQCSPAQKGFHYGFVLHGLWPQYDKGYPESCRTARRPYVRKEVIDGMLDIMPGKGLVIHEYRTHGTCSGLDPKGYFDVSRRLMQRIEIPRRFQNPQDTHTLSPADIIDDFVAANDGLDPDMVAVNCGGYDSRLEDVRICFTKAGEFRACGSNEDQDRLCRSRSVRVPPVRSTARSSSPLPGP